MATDKTEPPVKTILLIGSIAIGTLVGSEYFFQSYFNTMYGAEQQSQIYSVRSDTLLRARARDDEHLRNGNPVPIDEAMAAIARGDRPPQVQPQASIDFAAMHGWSQLPHEFAPGSPAAANAPLGGVVPSTPRADTPIIPSPTPEGVPVAAPGAPVDPGAVLPPPPPPAPGVGVPPPPPEALVNLHTAGAPAAHPAVAPAAAHPAVAPHPAPAPAGGNP